MDYDEGATSGRSIDGGTLKLYVLLPLHVEYKENSDVHVNTTSFTVSLIYYCLLNVLYY